MGAKETIKSFPNSPGVYLMKDENADIIYIGKANSLKKRTSSYFARVPASLKTQVLMSYVKSIECITTPSEHDALILEAQLIKKYLPRFNTLLRDDKSFPYIKITQEEIPRVFIGRRNKLNEKSDFFGPYTNTKLLRRALDILRKSFPFCTCRRFPKRLCLNFDLKLCPGPCFGKISSAEYRAIIARLEDFLTQKDSELIENLSRKMQQLVKNEKFEEAASVRDQLEALSILISLKKPVTKTGAIAQDDYGRLGLTSEPYVIEAFDISNISGRFAVGSMVSFCNGKPDKSNYRKFKIRAVLGADDCAMIREVVDRRYSRLKEENGKMPDLILIDGGRGQLEAGSKVLSRLGLDIPIISLAKREELVYTIGQKNPVRLKRNSTVLRLFQHVRNEAHRFAVSYHRLLRKKDVF